MATFIEKIPRSLIKVISWRILMVISLAVGGYLSSGSWKVGAAIASWGIIVNSALYFLHERVWNRLDWGKKTSI